MVEARARARSCCIGNVLAHTHSSTRRRQQLQPKSMQKGEIPDPRAGSTKFRAPPLSAAGVRVGYHHQQDIFFRVSWHQTGKSGWCLLAGEPSPDVLGVRPDRRDLPGSRRSVLDGDDSIRGVRLFGGIRGHCPRPAAEPQLAPCVHSPARGATGRPPQRPPRSWSSSSQVERP